VSDVKDPSSADAFDQILSAAGVAPLRQTGQPVPVPHLVPASRNESPDQLRTRADRRARSSRAHAPRASVLDWSALGVAVVLPPVGLVLSIAAHIVDRRRVGWASTVTKVATGVGCVLSIVLAAGTVVALDTREKTAAHDAIVASSAEFCSAVTSTDGLLTSDTFGWPEVGATIPLTIVAMEQYTARWMSIADVAPDGIQDGAQTMATAGQSVVDSVTASRTVDPAGNVALLQSAASSSGITAWAAEYCE
jgi:hypothetical protein